MPQTVIPENFNWTSLLFSYLITLTNHLMSSYARKVLLNPATMVVFEIPDFEGTGSDDGLTLLVHSIWHAALEVGVCFAVVVVHGFSIFARKIFQFSFET